MKLTIIFLTAAFLNVSAKGVSQGIRFSGKNVSLETVFAEVEKQTGYVFIFNDPVLADTKPVSIKADNVPLQQFLDQLFNGQPVDFTIKQKTIVVSRRVIPTIDLKSTTMILPPSIIRGRVLDADGAPLAGASIALKGGKVLGVTDAEGVFSVNVSVGDVLIISSVGFESTDYKISSSSVASSDQSSLTITLKRKESQLDEVIINKGYYTERKRLTTGNIARVTGKEIEKQPVSNPLQALIGQMPGVLISQVTGVPGGGFKVQIRGINSIGNGNDPLYLIDGVPFTGTSLHAFEVSTASGFANPLNNINPIDIENIEILKDADATAIYGSRGANGVVLITTKKGVSGKTKIDINTYIGAGKVSRKMDLLNTQQYLEMRKEAFKNDNATPQPWDYDLTAWDSTRYTDWQKKLIGGTSSIADAQLSVSGGNVNTQFLFGGGYYRETTVFPGDFAMQKPSVHFNLTHKSSDQKLTVNLSTNYVSVESNLPQYDLTNTALTLPPNAPAIYDENGELNWENSTWNNPFSFLKQQYEGRTDNLIGSASFAYQVLPHLQLKTNLGYTSLIMDETSLSPKNAFNPAYGLTSGGAIFGDNSVRTWIIEPQISYAKRIGQGQFNFQLGTTFQQSKSKMKVVTASGFPSDALLGDLGAASNISIARADNSLYRYNAIFGRLNYNWREKFIANVTARRDGSSRFGPGRQFADFGAFGLAWIFSKERFFQDKLGFLSFGKLRTSYGTTGNDQIGDYMYLDSYSPTERPYQGITGLAPNRLFNPDYGWEITKKIEAALELGFIQDRILIDISYYRNRSSDQLVVYTLPPTTGFSGILNNFPALVQNKGLEIELNTINIKTPNLNWSTRLNISFPRNKLIKYPGIETSPYANTYVVGQPLTIMKAFHFKGVDPTTGIYSFEDVNGNGSGIDYPDDLQAFKKVTQEYYGGINSSLQYKNWQFDISFQFVKQTGYSYQRIFSVPGTSNNQPVWVIDRWQKPGDNKSIQKFTQTFSSAYLTYLYGQFYGDNTIVDASFIRLKNLSIAYQFQTRSQKSKNIRIYLQGQNLLTITKYLGLDPENNGAAKLPPLSVLTAGIKLTL